MKWMLWDNCYEMSWYEVIDSRRLIAKLKAYGFDNILGIIVVVVYLAVTVRASECGVEHTKTADMINYCSSSNQCLLWNCSL